MGQLKPGERGEKEGGGSRGGPGYVCGGGEGVRGWPPGLLHHSVPGLGSGQDRGRSGPGSD